MRTNWTYRNIIYFTSGSPLISIAQKPLKSRIIANGMTKAKIYQIWCWNIYPYMAKTGLTHSILGVFELLKVFGGIGLNFRDKWNVFGSIASSKSILCAICLLNMLKKEFFNAWELKRSICLNISKSLFLAIVSQI